VLGVRSLFASMRVGFSKIFSHAAAVPLVQPPARTISSLARAWQLLLRVFILALAIAPPLMVVLDRWIGVCKLNSDAYQAICWVDPLLLYHPITPIYYDYITECIIGLFLLFVIFAKKDDLARFLSRVRFRPLIPAKVTPEYKQVLAGRILCYAAYIGVLPVFLSSLVFNRIPGWDMTLVLVAYLAGRIVIEVNFQRLAATMRRYWQIILAVGIAYTALVAFLARTSAGNGFEWQALVILLLASANLWRYRRRVHPIVWVAFLATILFSLNVNSWRYSGIGDELSFYTFARDIVNKESVWTIGSRLYGAEAVYGNLPYLSSLIAGVSMLFAGENHYGWVFSNIFLCSLAVVLFFLFVRKFFAGRVAWLSALFLAASSYIMNFSKIGYYSLQALFLMTLIFWAAGLAVQTKHPLSFTLLGFAMGGCFYTYPYALYVLPLPIFLLLLYLPPKSRTAARLWGHLLIPFAMLSLPLLFRPAYWRMLIHGTYLYSLQRLQWAGLAAHFISNFHYALFSYIYSLNETHFVVSSYVDPLTAVFVTIGMVWTFRNIRKSRLLIFIMLSFLAMVFLAGASHDYEYPPNTRMFMLLPFFTLFAGLGIAWLIIPLEMGMSASTVLKRGLAVLFILVVGLNLYQSTALLEKRYSHISIEILFLRMVQNARSLAESDQITYLFLTEKNWDIGGLRTMPDIYGAPRSQGQLACYIISQPSLPAQSLGQIQNENTVIIIQPWMDKQLQNGVNNELAKMGKKPCEVHNTTQQSWHFTIWLADKWTGICDVANRPGI
jgi:hypothetical protein